MVTIILPIILFLPEILINMINLQESTKLILNSIFIPLCVGIYLLIFILLNYIENGKMKPDKL
ncbi:hypothetical protein DZB91_14530 [Brevibacillus sp. VP]|nr:hypothetical protein DZB91_14530 [Brevibacillus sp. VP]